MKLISIPTQRDCLRLKWKDFSHRTAAPRMFGFQFFIQKQKKKKSKKNTMRVLVFLLIPLFTASVVCNRTDSDTNSDTDSDSDSDSDSDWEYESKKSCLVSLALHHPAAKHLKPLNKSRQNGFVVLTLASVMSWFGFEKSRIILCTPYIHLYSHGPWFAVEKS